MRSSDLLLVDVDFPALIAKKSEIITATKDLCSIVEPISRSEEVDGFFLTSRQYLALGCDLSDTQRLGRLLSKKLDLSACLILCNAEVSITYMPDDAADRLLRWAAALPEGECHIEALM